MAKITTKKPSSGGPPLTPKEEVQSKPVEESFLRRPIETAPVPPTPPKVTVPVAQATPPSMPQVRVTRPSETKAKSFSPPPPPPPVQAKKPNMTVLFLGGLLMIGISISKLNSGKTTHNELDYLPADQNVREMLIEDDRSKLQMAAWRNDEPGFFGRIFQRLCLGYAKSGGCSTRPLHPFEKVAEQLGITLNFEKEEDKKVIEQTIEYKSRAFTFGK